MARQGYLHPLDRPALYRICYEGVLDPDWSSRLGGMTITQITKGEARVVELAGPLVDQAALLGVLNSLYDIGLCLLSVERQEQ